MNIFATDQNPHKAAENLCDKHVVKMLTESVQMLCTAHHTAGSPASPSYLETIWKPAYAHHPCNIWVAESLSNWEWLADHAAGILHEYRLRYGDKDHKSGAMLKLLTSPNLPDKGLTPFRQAMPPWYQSIDPVDAYRRFIALGKNHFAKWTARPQSEPAWVQEIRSQEYYFIPMGVNISLTDTSEPLPLVPPHYPKIMHTDTGPIYLRKTDWRISQDMEYRVLEHQHLTIYVHGGILQLVNGHPESIFEETDYV